MNNDNTMIALAYIQSTDNPYDIFCKYICYALDRDEFKDYNNIRDEIYNSFGIALPFYLYSVCIQILESEGKVELKKERRIISGCKLLDETFNKNFFEIHKSNFLEQEQKLLEDIIKFADGYNKNWDVQTARRILGNFLNVNSSAMFLDGNDSLHGSHGTQIIKEYLNSLDDTSNYKRYIMDIVKGQMILIGSTYSDDKEHKKLIKGTCFYFDTKLILRFLGYTTEAYSSAVRDLVNIIQYKYNGRVCVFDRTIDEVCHALSKLCNSIKKKGIPDDYEMLLYYQSNKNKITASDIEIYARKESIKKHLSYYNIYPEENIQWEKKEDWIFNIDQEELLDIIKNKKPSWSVPAIENDIDSFIQINMLRKGDYSTAYGGEKVKLPIFVTSNYPLIGFIKEYIKSAQTSNGEIRKNPFIGDNVLMCQLWLPICNEDNQTPTTIYNLTANAISSFENSFFNKLRDNAKALRKKHKLSVIDIKNERFKQMQDKLLKNNIDIENDLDENAIFTNYEETLAADKIEIEKEKDYYCNLTKDLEQQLSNKDVELIKEKANKYLRFSLWKLLYYLSNWGLMVVCLVIVLVSTLINYARENIVTRIASSVGFIGFIISLMLKFVDKKISKYSDKVNSFFLNTSYQCLRNKIIKHEGDKDYSEQILEYIVSETKYFKKPKKD